MIEDENTADLTVDETKLVNALAEALFFNPAERWLTALEKRNPISAESAEKLISAADARLDGFAPTGWAGKQSGRLGLLLQRSGLDHPPWFLLRMAEEEPNTVVLDHNGIEISLSSLSKNWHIGVRDPMGFRRPTLAGAEGLPKPVIQDSPMAVFGNSRKQGRIEIEFELLLQQPTLVSIENLLTGLGTKYKIDWFIHKTRGIRQPLALVLEKHFDELSKSALLNSISTCAERTAAVEEYMTRWPFFALTRIAFARFPVETTELATGLLLKSSQAQDVLRMFEFARNPFDNDHVSRLKSHKITLRLPSLQAPALDAFLLAHGIA